ncbi:MAG TPA: heavy metal-associated domain-containing protein [Candidatus Micrarchaeota archaeon]|nr:heavy metal-associated domain-containing protein [Candidatus Micrarchaeota archaeon]
MRSNVFRETVITRKEAKDVFKKFKSRSNDQLHGINTVIVRVAQRHFSTLSLDDIEAARKLIRPQMGSSRYNEGSDGPRYEVKKNSPAQNMPAQTVDLYMPKSIGNKVAAARLGAGIGMSALFAGSTLLVVANSTQHPMVTPARYIDIPFTDSYIPVPAIVINSVLNISALMAGIGTAGKLFIYSVKEFKGRPDKVHDIAVALDGAITEALKIVMANKILTATIKVGGITDERDFNAIEKAINEIKGAKVLTMDKVKNLVVVQYNFTSVLEDAKAAVKAQGYTISS